MCFVPYLGILRWGRGGGVPKGIGTPPACAFFHSRRLQNPSIRNLIFWNVLGSHTDYIGHVKRLLGIFFVFFTQFGCGMWVEGVPQGIGTQPASAFGTLGSSKIDVTKQGLLDQSQAAPHIGENTTEPHFWASLGDCISRCGILWLTPL